MQFTYCSAVQNRNSTSLEYNLVIQCALILVLTCNYAVQCNAGIFPVFINIEGIVFSNDFLNLMTSLNIIIDRTSDHHNGISPVCPCV